MAVVTSAVVGATVAVGSAVSQRSAQKRAANQQAQANIESADLLDRAGRDAEADILRQNALAIQSAARASEEAEEPLAPFADVGAIERAQDEIINNLPVGGAIAQSIKQASTDFIKNRPEFQSAFLNREIDRQGDLAVGAATPQFRDSLLALGQQGLAATGDIAQIRQRGLQRLGDIAGGQAAQRATALIGQAPQLQQLQTGAQEARLLGDVASQGFATSAVESAAGLAGQLIGGRRRNRSLEKSFDDPTFDFAPGEF